MTQANRQREAVAADAAEQTATARAVAAEARQQLEANAAEHASLLAAAQSTIAELQSTLLHWQEHGRLLRTLSGSW